MANINDLLAQIPLDRVAAALGVDEQTAEQATRLAVPALVQGMQANATASSEQATSLAKALVKHAQAAGGGVADVPVDPADGAKIVHNVFGANEDQIVNKLGSIGGGGGLGGDLFKKLLPMLAPLVLAWVGKSVLGGGGGGSAAAAPQAPASPRSGGGGLGGLLGGLFGKKDKAPAPAPAPTGGGGIDDLLGGLLGGGGAGAGGLGDLLGGLLGGSGAGGGGGADLGDLLGGLFGGGRS